MIHMRHLRWLPALLALCIAPAAASGQAGAKPAKAAGVNSADATFIGDADCLACHDKYQAGLDKSLHGKAIDARTPAAARSCQACHGPGSKHVEDPENNGMLNFNKISASKASAVCVTCHATGEHTLFAGSKHELRNVSCMACHSVHAPKGEQLLKAETQVKLCATCHQSIVNKVYRFNHMPVREGKMACASCHNVHGSANVKLLKAGTTVDQSCASCHAEKRGPFLWEHAPVSNACVTCHDPHGSNNDRMLVAKAPFLCQRCHVTSRHPPTVYNPFLTKTSQNANKFTGRGCMVCHSQIHGSNSPNGKALLR